MSTAILRLPSLSHGELLHMGPYVLSQDEGRCYLWEGWRFTVKAGGIETHDGLGFMEFVTRQGEEPPPHVHQDEDEIFYVLEGALKFRCGTETLEATENDFVFLPRNIEHTYEITSGGSVRLLILTTPNKFVNFIEATGERLDAGID